MKAGLRGRRLASDKEVCKVCKVLIMLVLGPQWCAVINLSRVGIHSHLPHTLSNPSSGLNQGLCKREIIGNEPN